MGGETSLAREFLEAAQEDSVRLVGCAKTVDEAASMVDVCEADVVLVVDSENQGEVSAGSRLDALKTSLRLASLRPTHDLPGGPSDTD